MSDNIMNFNFLKENYGITYSEYTKLLKEADMGDNDESIEDGNIDKNVFEEVLRDYCDTKGYDYSKIEDDYASAFDAIAGMDGDGESLSYQDFGNYAADKTSSTSSDNNYANSSEYKDRQNKTPVALQGKRATEASPVKANDLMGQDVETLRTERAAISDQIQVQRDEMETAKAEKQTAVDEAEKAYQARLDRYADAIEDKKEAGEDLGEKEQEYQDLKAKRDEKNTQINDQKNVITDLKSGVESQKTAIQLIGSQLTNHLGQEPKLDSYTKQETDAKGNPVTDEQGNPKMVADEVAWQAAHTEWVTRKNELEKQQQLEEDKLSEYEQQLGEAENALKVLEQEVATIDADITKIQEQLAQENETIAALEEQSDYSIDDLKTALDTAKSELESVTAPYEANIAQLQLNLTEYDTAISQAESNSKIEEKEGMESLGSYTNTALDATASAKNDDILAKNSVTLSNDEQIEYLENYLGEGNYGELISSDDNPGYFSKQNEDGTIDCFKVVNDSGEIKVIHTNIPDQGDPATEIYGVDPLKDENGEDRTYSKYATSEEGVLVEKQVNMLVEELQNEGQIPEDIDITKLSNATLSSIIENYGDGEDFVANFASDQEVANALKTQLDEYLSGRHSVRWEEQHEQTYAARRALSKGEPAGQGIISEKGKEYLKQIQDYTEDMNGDGVVVNDYDLQEEYRNIAETILKDKNISSSEAMELLSVIYSQEVAGNDVKTIIQDSGFDSSLNTPYMNLLTRTWEEGGDVTEIIEMIESYKEITGQDELLFSPISDSELGMSPEYAANDLIYNMYLNATQEEIQRLNEAFPDFTIQWQHQYSHEEETTKLENLFTNIEASANVDYESRYNEEGWSSSYGDPGKSTFKEIIKNSDGFKDPNNFIAALLWASNGNMNNFTEYFRDLSSSNQEKYLPIIMEAFGGKWNEE